MELWNDNLIDEFVKNYYGKAAPYILKYLKNLEQAVKSGRIYLSISNPAISSSYLTPEFLKESHQLFREAENAVKDSPDLLFRTKKAHAPVIFALIYTWPRFRERAKIVGKPLEWPVRESWEDLYCEFIEIAQKAKIVRLSETKAFPPPVSWKKTYQLPRKIVGAPELFKDISDSKWFDLQDNMMRMHNCGKFVEMIADPSASDGYALKMRGNHKEWAVQAILPQRLGADSEWEVYVFVKVTNKKPSSSKKPAFSVGIYDYEKEKSYGKIAVSFKDLQDTPGYRAYKVGACRLKPIDAWTPYNRISVWVAPENKAETDIFIDRIILVRK